MVPLTPLLALEVAPWVRVDDPTWPGALVRSATGATLAAPPPAGVAWRYEALAVPDPVPDVAVSTARVGGAAGDPLSVTNADAWHARGITGAGVKVAVFDSGFYAGDIDLAPLGAFETHDCALSTSCAPPMDLVAPPDSFSEGSHGIACAEIIRQVAPDAELHLLRVSTFTTFENAVAWAVREGVDVVSMSMSFYNQSFYDGRGPFDAQLELLESAGALLVSSSGNNATSHWAGGWTDGDFDDRLDGEGDNGVSVYDRGDKPTFYLSWNQFGRCGLTDLDLYVYDLEGNRLGAAEADQRPGADHCEPVEALTSAVSPDGWYRLEVVRRTGSVVGLQVDLLPRDMAVWQARPEGTVADPGSNPLTFAVGAIRADGYLTNPIESFSSRGPTNAGISKPDLAGPDGLTSMIYGDAGFYGTSASTPAVAGLVALVLSDDESLTSRAAAQRLQGWAFGEAGLAPDNTFGAGRARLPVLSEDPQPCGRRPMVLSLFLVPVWWSGRRRARPLE